MKSIYKTIIVLSSLQVAIFANPIDSSINTIEKSNDKLKNFQKVIDKNDSQIRDLIDEYKYVNSSLNASKKYNEQLEKIVNSQKNEVKSLDQQILDIEQTQKNIYPLMKDMIKSLKTLINQDAPFLLKERLDRVERLEKSLDKADIQTHEKYRIILEAFKIEYDYAKTIESYQDKLNGKTYNFLRLGRTALYFQSLDLKEYGYFNKQTSSWEKIEDSVSKSNIRKAIKIARKQQNVDFLNLPFQASKESK